jgi:hypothetical protein
MVTCKYCGIYYETFRSTCPSCGAPLQMEKEEVPEKTEAQIIADKIRHICDHHMNIDFKDGESISDKGLDKIRKSFRVSQMERKSFFIAIQPHSELETRVF